MGLTIKITIEQRRGETKQQKKNKKNKQEGTCKTSFPRRTHKKQHQKKKVTKTDEKNNYGKINKQANIMYITTITTNVLKIV